MTGPLLRCRGARIEAAGDALLTGLDFEADGRRVVLVGAWEPLFRLCSARATLPAGSVEVLGRPATEAVRDGTLGVALADAPFFGKWKIVESLAASARLLGMGRKDALRASRVALERLGQGALEKRKIADLDRAGLRVLALAHALVGDPAVVAIERPLESLTDEGALEVEVALGRAAEGARLMVNLAAPAKEGPEARLLASADAVVTLVAGRAEVSPGVAPGSLRRNGTASPPA